MSHSTSKLANLKLLQNLFPMDNIKFAFASNYVDRYRLVKNMVRNLLPLLIALSRKKTNHCSM